MLIVVICSFTIYKALWWHEIVAVYCLKRLLRILHFVRWLLCSVRTILHEILEVYFLMIFGWRFDSTIYIFLICQLFRMVVSTKLIKIEVKLLSLFLCLIDKNWAILCVINQAFLCTTEWKQVLGLFLCSNLFCLYFLE